MAHPYRYACGGIAFVVPFVIANIIVVGRHATGAALQTAPWVPMMFLLLMFVGAVVASWPIWRQRHWYWLNGIISIIIAVISIVLIGAFAEEFLRCEILAQPNCD